MKTRGAILLISIIVSIAVTYFTAWEIGYKMGQHSVQPAPTATQNSTQTLLETYGGTYTNISSSSLSNTSALTDNEVSLPSRYSGYNIFLGGVKIYPIPKTPPVVITKEVVKQVPVYITTTVEKEKIVTQNVVVEKTVYTGNLTTFKTFGELRDWVNKWNYKLVQLAPGVNLLAPSVNDCDKWSMQMVKDAVHDGYYMGLVMDAGQAHMLVFSPVGNDLYFIEPQDKSIFRVLNNSYWTLDK